MQLKTLLIASLLGTAICAPVTAPTEKAVANTRFVTYKNEAKKRDVDANPCCRSYEKAATAEGLAVVNSRFVTYEDIA